MNHYEYEAKPSKNHRNKLSYVDKAIHAEEMAIDKIHFKKARKIINVSIIVIRITLSSTIDCYHLANSRPCIACMHKINNTTPLGFRINNVYFSDNNGNILRYKLRDIIKEKQHVSKFYRIVNIPKYLTYNDDDYDANKQIK